MLDGTTGDQRVTTLADSRTPVLLGEIADLIADPRRPARPAGRAPCSTYDARHGVGDAGERRGLPGRFGDVREAAAELQVHPNTLRYRIAPGREDPRPRPDDPAGRLLVELQLLVLRRTG